MLKTLIIAPYYPIPENSGGNIRTMNFARYFLKHGDVDILCQNGSSPLPENSSPFRHEYFMVDFDNNKKNSYYRRIIDKLVHKKTWMTGHFTSENEIMIRKIITDGEYNYVICRYISQAFPLLRLNNKQKDNILLDVDDIVTETIYDLDTADIKGFSRLNKMVDKRILKSYYNNCMTLGSILFCSEADKAKVTDRAVNLRCHVVPNVCPQIKLPANYRVDGFHNSNHILFVGFLHYEPNCQGITWFINNIFPRLLEQYQDVKLLIVGRHPPEGLITLTQQHPNIELHADPPDIAPFYNTCGIVIVPLFAGGGTRIKILEAGLASRPVISTEIGAYGLGLTDGKEIMIFSDTESFIDKYRRLRDDKELYSRMVQSLSTVISSNYSFDNFCHSMDAVVAAQPPKNRPLNNIN
jgi:glycosyltransferase involved in cell wall biosynthesis